VFGVGGKYRGAREDSQSGGRCKAQRMLHCVSRFQA
jgi:hypothetical protein